MYVIKIQTTILPDAKLHNVGFVENMDHLLDSKMATLKLHKSENFTISFYVKNEGQTTIDEEIELKQMKINNPLVYKLIKEGTPPVEEEPGFHGFIALISILVVYIIIRRTKI